MNIIDKIRNDKDIIKMKIEWLELAMENWLLYNDDDYESIEDYKKTLRKKLNIMNNLSEEEKQIRQSKFKTQREQSGIKNCKILYDLDKKNIEILKNKLKSKH